MPETKEVRAACRALAKRNGWKSWCDTPERRDEALRAVYADMGLPYRPKKRKRAPEPAPPPSCCVCLEEGAALLTLAPCGHRCVCAGCLEHITGCPICRARIESAVTTIYDL